jgi:predicted RNA-binding protein YlqC (UPF0109 family)
VENGEFLEFSWEEGRELERYEGDVSMKELVRVVACALVDRPDQVEVVEVTGGTTSVIELRVAKEDVGKIIGRQGHTANAIRTILNGVAAKLKKRVVLEIVE